MKPPEKINTKGVLFVIMLALKDTMLFQLVWKITWKKNISILRTFSTNFEQVIPAENK